MKSKIIVYFAILGLFVISYMMWHKTESKGISAEINMLEERNALLSVTSGLNSGYYELYNKDKEAIVRTFDGDTTAIYKQGKAYIFKDNGTKENEKENEDVGVSVTIEDGLPTLELLKKIVRTGEEERQQNENGENLYIYKAEEVPTQDKLLNEFIRNNVQECTGVQVEINLKPVLQGNIKIMSNKGNVLYATFSGYQELNNWKLDTGWNTASLKGKDNSYLQNLRKKELSKLQNNILVYMQTLNKSHLKNGEISGEDYINATTEQKQRYVDDVLSELVKEYSVVFTGDRVSMVRQLEEYYEANGTDLNLVSTVQYLCYTQGLLVPYEYTSDSEEVKLEVTTEANETTTTTETTTLTAIK